MADPMGRGVRVYTTSTPPTHEAANVVYVCRLIVAADGAGSRVVQALRSSQPTEDWDMHAVSSAAAGLNIKVRASRLHCFNASLLHCFDVNHPLLPPHHILLLFWWSMTPW